MKPSEGNGADQVNLTVTWGDDWVMFCAGEPEPSPDALPYLLLHGVNRFTQENPRCRIRDSLSIVANGNTVAVRLWFDGPPPALKN